MPNSISEEPINRLPSNSGGSANQLQLFYMPNSSSEEPIHPLPSNMRGSAHQFDQLAETESESEIWSAEHLNYYRPLYLAAQGGRWETAKRFIEHDPNALTATITAITKETVLHVAAYCSQWEFVLKLLELTSPESIVTKSRKGKTALHHAALGGSLKTAKALVQKNADLLQIGDDAGDLPLLYATWSGNKELVWYLSLKTRVDSPTPPFFIPSLPGILYNLIISGYHDIALIFVQKYPNLAIARDKDGDSLLYWLATNPSSFFSGSNLYFLERWIYNSVDVEIINAHSVMINMENIPEFQLGSFETQALRWFKRFLWKTIAQLVPSMKKVQDAKLKHECAVELVNRVCTQLSSMSFHEIIHFLQNRRIMARAVAGGIEEIVYTLFQKFPDLIHVHHMSGRNILQVAVEYRQVKIVNLLKKIFPTSIQNLSSFIMESRNTTLHLTGKLAPATGSAALQMQRALQWFKEVEYITLPYQREWRNANNETAKDVFEREHHKLAEQGEKWMKDMVNAYMLVSTLVATVLFAAAFTVPGGNVSDNGIPFFLRTNAFAVFAISDALGLFSSLTSLLMFLTIITARYVLEDFLESLPKMLSLGLVCLFLSIATMIIAFGAALTIVLDERWHLISVPIILLASHPVAMFVKLQLPLIVEIVRLTYGASIFLS